MLSAREVGFFLRVRAMALRGMRVMGARLVLVLLVMLRRFAVMLGRLVVMVGSAMVMLGRWMFVGHVRLLSVRPPPANGHLRRRFRSAGTQIETIAFELSWAKNSDAGLFQAWPVSPGCRCANQATMVPKSSMASRFMIKSAGVKWGKCGFFIAAESGRTT